MAKKTSPRGRSSIPPPHPVSPAPRSLPRLPTRRYSLSRSPVTSRVGGGGRDTQTKKKWALLPPCLDFPRSFPRFFLCLVPGYLSDSPTCARTLPALIARPPSILY
jgi:hypothetical protein